MLYLPLIASLIVAASTPMPTVEIAPGVHMPMLNLGGVHSHPSNYSAWIDLGATGLDTAMMYGEPCHTVPALSE